MKLREALEISLDYEQKVRDHYRKGAGLIAEPAGRRFFEVLAREEQRHVDFVLSRLSMLDRGGSPGPATVGSIIPPEWIEQAKRRMAAGPSGALASKRDVELVQLALDLELETSGFYHSLMDKLETTVERALFLPFLEIEDGHVAIVRAELDSLLGRGFWFDFQDFRIEAG